MGPLIRRLGAAFFVAGMAMSCSPALKSDARPDIRSEPRGAVVADEAVAAEIGQQILFAGGTAADGAVAMGFALGVTVPSSAGLGGGGVCVVWDGKKRSAEMLNFLAMAPDFPVPKGFYGVGVPGMARGLFVLHSRYGRLGWAGLVEPAERLARLSVAKGNSAGAVSLAAVLGTLRRGGIGDFYSGSLGRLYVDAVRADGGYLDRADMHDFAPRWVQTIGIPIGEHEAHFAAPPAAGGGVSAAILAMMLDRDRLLNSERGERDHLLVEAFARAYSDRDRWMEADGNAVVAPGRITYPLRIKAMMDDYDKTRHVPAQTKSQMKSKIAAENPSTTSFAVLDANGNAVACVLSLNGPFGTGHRARGLGIFPASVRGVGGVGAGSLGPVIIGNARTGNVYLAAGASGGAAAPTALALTIADVALGDGSLARVLEKKRVHTTGVPDLVFYESGFNESRLAALSDRGHKTVAASVLGLVNAIHCPDGSISDFSSCRAGADPRGAGLSFIFGPDMRP